MHLNAGVSASGAGADASAFILYRLPLHHPDGASPSTTPNEPPVVTFYEEKTMDITAQREFATRRDAHGLTMSPSRRFLYQFDRIRNNAEVFDMGKVIGDLKATPAEQAQAHAGTLDLTGSGYCVGEPAPFVNMHGDGYRIQRRPCPGPRGYHSPRPVAHRLLPGAAPGHRHARGRWQLSRVRHRHPGRRWIRRRPDPRLSDLPARRDRHQEPERHPCRSRPHQGAERAGGLRSQVFAPAAGSYPDQACARPRATRKRQRQLDA